METPKQLIDTRANVLLGDTTAPSPRAFVMKAPIRTLGTVPAPEGSVRWARIGFGCFRSPTAGLKPFVDEVRNVPPFGLPKAERQHEKESHVVGLIDTQTEPVPVSIDIGACGIVRRTGLRPTASRVCARAA